MPPGWRKPGYKPSSQDTKQGKRRISSSFFFKLMLRYKVCPNRLQSSESYQLTSLWGHLKQQTYKSHACILPYGSFLLMKNGTKNRDKEKHCPSPGRKGSIKTKSTQTKCTKVTYFLLVFSEIPKISAVTSKGNTMFQPMTSHFVTITVWGNFFALSLLGYVFGVYEFNPQKTN